MNAREKASQIVQVTSDCRLLDGQRAEHTYWRKDGCGLAKGWYIVSWPSDAMPERFNVDAQFRGPFSKRKKADAALRKLFSVAREGTADPASWGNGVGPALSGGAFPQSRLRQTPRPSSRTLPNRIWTRSLIP